MIEIHYAPDVEAARKNGTPLIALESTIITHGLPHPQNLDIARRIEAEIRAQGATPATIAVLKGRLHIGLTDAQLEILAQSEGVLKLSRADLPVALATGATGTTTVAATMIAAQLAGIEVFATGGIGGVHRGAEISFDISADLQELAQTRVTVVAAGAKAILDLPKTLEVLETLGVPVIAYGQDAFPAFWTADSGLTAPLRLDSPRDIARSHRARAQIGLTGGQLVANPIPKPDEIPRPEIERAIATALKDADFNGIKGKDVTPYLLDRIQTLTQGRSVVANIALVLNNARLGARIAVELGAATR